MIIKILLIGSFVGLALFAARMGSSPQHRAIRRLGALVVFVAAVVSVINPDLVTQVANAVGVGRGTDLVLYAFVVVSVLVWLSVYRRISDMDQRMTALVRTYALADARTPRSDPPRS